ncbi:MAG: hypothetical protein WD007_05255 [Nitriliruptoraceae bacterium]
MGRGNNKPLIWGTAMHDEPWPDNDHTRRPTPKPFVIAIAVLPWIVVALVVARSGDDDRSAAISPSGPLWATDAAADPANGAVDSPGDSHTDMHTTHVHPSDAWPPTSTGPVAPTSAVHQAAGAAATAIARAWITGIDPQLGINGLEPAGDSWYVEHLAVEAIEAYDNDIAVIALIAIVIGGPPEALTADVRRVAVPMSVRGVPRPAGVPWWLPEPQWDVTPPVSHLVEDPDAQQRAVEALRHAGYTDVQLVELRRSDGWPWLAHIQGRTHAGQPVDGQIMLYRARDRFVVAGSAHLDDPAWTSIPTTTPRNGHASTGHAPQAEAGR